MRELFRYPSVYLVLPLFIAAVTNVLIFRMAPERAVGVGLLLSVATMLGVIDCFSKIRLPSPEAFRTMTVDGSRERLVVLSFCYFVILFCMIDLVAFPIPLIHDPSSYANLEGGRVHIRHISYLCWILPPIGLLCFESRVMRAFFIAVGVIFPIMVLDRNRLLAGLFSLLLVVVLRKKSGARSPWIMLVGLVVAASVGFALLGTVRSGHLQGISLPFTSFYTDAPSGAQWLLLYVGSGLYNFSAILAQNYHNPDFLINQLVPFMGSVATLGTSIPLDAPRINTGTEFLPFLMAFGWMGAVVAVCLLYGMLLLSAFFVEQELSLISLLIFLRVSYVSVMAGFAPQAFIWSTFGFVGLGVFLLLVSRLLPNEMDCRKIR